LLDIQQFVRAIVRICAAALRGKLIAAFFLLNQWIASA